MITIKLKPWVPIDGLTHAATTYQIATDINFINIIDEVIEDSVNLTLYYSKVIVPIGVTYYGRYKRHFNTGNESSWSTVREITNTNISDGLIVNYDIIIDEPMVFIDVDKILTSDTIEIETSFFRGAGDGHYATHWIILDIYNNILYSALYDEVNLTKITIPKTEVMTNDLNRIIIKASHISASGIESGYGEAIVDVYNFNFEVTSHIKRIIPYVDYRLKLSKIDPALSNNINKIELKSLLSEELIWSEAITEEIEYIDIPGVLLAESNTYIVDIYVSNINIYEPVIRRINIETSPKNEVNIVDTNFKYTKVIKYKYTSQTPILAPNTHVNELYNKTIPHIANNSQSIKKMTYDHNTEKLVSELNSTVTGLSLLNMINTGTFYKYLTDNTILIDTISNTGKPIFMHFQYNVVTRTATMLNSVERQDETLPIGTTNAFVQVNETEFIYIPVNTNKICKLDISTMGTAVLKEIPIETNVPILLIDIGRGRYMCIGGTAQKGYVYNIITNTFSDGVSVVSEFRNRELRSVRLVNGDYLIYKTTSKVDDTKSVLYYNITEGVLNKLEMISSYTFSFSNSILLSNGKVLLINNDTADNKYFMFE